MYLKLHIPLWLYCLVAYLKADSSTQDNQDITSTDDTTENYLYEAPCCTVPGKPAGCVVCIQLCCPEGNIRQIDRSWTHHRCDIDSKDQPKKICAPPNSDIQINFQTYQTDKGEVFKLKSAPGRFYCPSRHHHYIQANYYYMNTSVTSTGLLMGSVPLPDQSLEFTNHSAEEFCLVHMEDEKNSEIVKTNFMICAKDQSDDTSDKDFTMVFYPSALLISSVFLLLTLISYAIDSDLHRPLFGKITLGFILNLLMTYIFLATGYITSTTGSLEPGSSPCMILGYATYYFYLAFMFWINAMAASICLKFSAILSAASDNETKKFLINMAYAQGFPLIICIIVSLIDRFGDCSWTRPDMGAAQCFIGAPKMEVINTIGFFRTAEFLYFQSISLVLQVMNIIFFMITVYFLVDHWKNSSNLTRSGENRGNFLIVVKLFFIMGIPWLGEFLSLSLSHSMGATSSFYYRIILDTLNLFTGVLVFLVLICKKKTVRRVRNRLTTRSQLSRGSTMTTSTKDTVNWYRDKESSYRGGTDIRLQVLNKQHLQHQQPSTEGYLQHQHSQQPSTDGYLQHQHSQQPPTEGYFQHQQPTTESDQLIHHNLSRVLL